ncbi:unnamed protein product [Mesocestoides corti]|uniref:XdhC_CoxI domain-containing protein n=1 Tax=Mesocestoides corti TaxID=53468 RepID=A0A0R3UCD9_MESCO|nr:unnamed protein product [Mesocestoides corti]
MVGGRTKDKDCGFDHHRGEHSSDDLRPPQHDFSILSFEAQVIGIGCGKEVTPLLATQLQATCGVRYGTGPDRR